MQIRRVTTAEAPVGVITQIDEIFDPSTVETGIDVLDLSLIHISIGRCPRR